MQRWIALGVLLMMLAAGGGGYAYWMHRQNRPAPIWVPLPINREVSDEKRDEIIIQLKTQLEKPELLAQVSRDLNLATKWNLASPEEAAAEIKKRLFVRAGETETQMGKNPSINIGVEGPLKDKEISSEIAMRLMQDVKKILGIKPPMR